MTVIRVYDDRTFFYDMALRKNFPIGNREFNIIDELLGNYNDIRLEYCTIEEKEYIKYSHSVAQPGQQIERGPDSWKLQPGDNYHLLLDTYWQRPNLPREREHTKIANYKRIYPFLLGENLNSSQISSLTIYTTQDVDAAKNLHAAMENYKNTNGLVFELKPYRKILLAECRTNLALFRDLCN